MRSVQMSTQAALLPMVYLTPRQQVFPMAAADSRLHRSAAQTLLQSLPAYPCPAFGWMRRPTVDAYCRMYWNSLSSARWSDEYWALGICSPGCGHTSASLGSSSTAVGSRLLLVYRM